jgi:hypothetical protein
VGVTCFFRLIQVESVSCSEDLPGLRENLPEMQHFPNDILILRDSIIDRNEMSEKGQLLCSLNQSNQLTTR